MGQPLPGSRNRAGPIPPQQLHCSGAGPDSIQRILNVRKPLAIDLQSILQLDCLAGSEFTFYAFWLVRCFLLPGLILAIVGLQYVYERWRVDNTTALGYFKANAFVVVFLCYVSLLDVPIMQRVKVLTGKFCSFTSLAWGL